MRGSIGRSDAKLHIVQNEIVQAGGQAFIVLCDVKEPASVGIAFQQIGQLDVFINSAGIGIFGPLEEYTIDDIELTLNTNIKGTILTVQSALPLIRKSGGRILTIISTAGLRGKTNESIYCASKFAMKGFTESLQKEWENESISITGVYMGGMDTPFWESTSHIKNTSSLKKPEVVAEQIFKEDDGRNEIFIAK